MNGEAITKANTFKTFLSIAKTFIYLGIALLGFLAHLAHQPGNLLVLAGLGLFLGHVSYRSVKFKRLQLLRIITLLVTVIFIGVLLFLHYNFLRASLIILIAAGISLLIEFISKKY